MKQLWLAVAIFFGLGLLGLSTNPAAAQDYQSLRNQIDQLRQQVRQLSAQVNDLSRGGGAPSSTGAVGGGESPETMARLDEIVESMRRLNGRVEEIEFKVDNLSRGLDTVKRDVDLKPAVPAASAPTGTTPSPAATNPPNTASPSAATTAPASASSVDNGPYNANEAPRTLGSMPIDPGASQKSAEKPAAEKPVVEKPTVEKPKPEKPAVVEAPAADTVVAAVAPAAPKEQYDAAHRLLKNAQYGEAETAFRQFLETNPKDPNVEKASYWLGETFYARKQYDQAYQTYARNLQRWPKGEKAPDNLVKLSLSLVSLKRDSEACQFLAVLDSDYPNAAANVKQAGERAKKLAKCK